MGVGAIARHWHLGAADLEGTGIECADGTGDLCASWQVHIKLDGDRGVGDVAKTGRAPADVLVSLHQAGPDHPTEEREDNDKGHQGHGER